MNIIYFPIYILNDGGRLAFASEMKSFKALPNFKFEPDFQNLDEFLLFRNVINKKEIYRNIYDKCGYLFHFNVFIQYTI